MTDEIQKAVAAARNADFESRLKWLTDIKNLSAMDVQQQSRFLQYHICDKINLTGLGVILSEMHLQGLISKAVHDSLRKQVELLRETILWHKDQYFKKEVNGSATT